MAELADASHSECGGGNLRAGSSPVRGTINPLVYLLRRFGYSNVAYHQYRW